MPKRIFHPQQEWIQNIQAWITTSLFALIVSLFTLRLLQVPTPGIPVLFAAYLGLTLLIYLVLRAWKWTLAALVLIGFGCAVQWLTKSTWDFPLVGLDWWQELLFTVRGAVQWSVTLIAERGTMPPAFLRVFTVFVALLSVLTNWALPIPILNMLFLITPLFYIPDLTSDPRWLIWLLLGLFCVYASYAYRQDPERRDQRPPLIFGISLLALTFLLQAVLPAELFFSERLSQRINDVLPTQTNTEISSFSLAELGFYPQGNLRVGGPVVLSDDPYLEIRASADAFYLRGSSYDTFDGNSWSMQQSESLVPFQWDENFYDDFSSQQAQVFWFADASLRDTALSHGLFLPSLYYMETEKPGRIVFHGGKPMAITQLTQDPPAGVSIDELVANYNANTAFYYSASGMVASEKDYNEAGLILVDYVTPVASMWSTETHALLSPARQGRGKRAYEATVKATDPELGGLLYDQDLPFPALLAALRAHFDANYTYALDVPLVPNDENFIAHFLTNKSGYCVYFATAYSVLLEDIGYPTRYAEGFVVPQASGISNTEAAARTITARQAHAWTEIFVDGYGWVPVEATPSTHISEMSGVNGDQPSEEMPEPAIPETLDAQESSENEESSEESSQASSEEPDALQDSETSDEMDSSEEGSLEDNTNIFSQYKWLWMGLGGALIVILLLLLWMRGRWNAWKQRLDASKVSSAGNTPMERFQRMHEAILRLMQRPDESYPPSDTIGQLLKQTTAAQDATSAANASPAWTQEDIARMEAIIYGAHEPEADDVMRMHQWYRTLAIQHRDALRKARWFWHDVLTWKGHPW